MFEIIRKIYKHLITLKSNKQFCIHEPDGYNRKNYDYW